MGGYGSGRRGTRATVDDCLTVDANVAARTGLFKQGSRHAALRWSRGGNKNGACGVYVKIDETSVSMTFIYTYKGQDHPEVKVYLSSYAPGFGGCRYFFICPNCMRRVRTLHFNRGEIACRLCHNLTYRSCNESHSSDRIFMMIAAGNRKHTWKEFKQCMNYHTHRANKEPKRPRGRPRECN